MKNAEIPDLVHGIVLVAKRETQVNAVPNAVQRDRTEECEYG